MFAYERVCESPSDVISLATSFNSAVQPSLFLYSGASSGLGATFSQTFTDATTRIFGLAMAGKQ